MENKKEVPVKRGDEVTLTITDLAYGGNGVARYENFTIFVAEGIPGDEVTAVITLVKKNFAEAEIKEVIKESENYVKPPCPAFGKCGGCQWLHLKYSEQLKYKMKFIEHSIRVNGGIEGVKVNDIIQCSQPLYYRDRAQYKLAKNYYGISMGFYKKMSHEVVGINECFIVDEKINKLASAIALFLNANKDEVILYDEIKSLGYLKHIAIRVNRAGESLITFVVGRARVEDFIVRCTKELKEKFGDIKGVVVNINTDPGNRVFGDRDITVDGENFLEEKVKDVTFLLGPDTFFQVNSTMLEAMMDFTGRHIGKGSVVLDLYGGIGALTLPFHNVAAEIIVVDINKKSMELFDKITKLNGISGANALTADAEAESGRVLAEKKPDVVVLDPPRKGIHPGIIKSIKENRIKEIIYISCNPMTFGRDIKELKDEYDLIEVQPIDLFPNTYHVETMSYLRRKA